MKLTQRERRMTWFGGVGLAAYLGLFGVIQVWRELESGRAAYLELHAEARREAAELMPAENRVLLAQKLKKQMRFEPGRLARASLVAEASAAIQQAAREGGVQVVSLRESAARASTGELATMQFEGMGQVPGVLGLLNRLESLGYPLVVDAVQISSDPRGPGMVKLSLTIVLLDFEQWKGKEVGRA